MSEQKAQFIDRTGWSEAAPELWEPAIVRKADFDAEIERLAALALAIPEIEEIDINPLMLLARGRAGSRCPGGLAPVAIVQAPPRLSRAWRNIPP